MSIMAVSAYLVVFVRERLVADAAAPYRDAIASLTSFAANRLLARRGLENWLRWMADVVYVGLFAWKGLYASALLSVVFFALCVAGLVHWRREYAAQRWTHPRLEAVVPA